MLMLMLKCHKDRALFKEHIFKKINQNCDIYDNPRKKKLNGKY